MRKIPFAGIELTSQRVRGYMVPLSYRGDLGQLKCASLSHIHHWYQVGVFIIIIISAHQPDLSNPWSQSARSIPSVPKLKLMASRHQKKNTRTRRRGNLHHGVRKKGLSNYSSTNYLLLSEVLFEMTLCKPAAETD